MSRPDPAQFSAITFDCYGTLIDWESGILAAMQPVLVRHGVQASLGDVLQAYGRAEAAAEKGSYLPYGEVLRRTLTGMAKDLGFSPQPDEVDVLADSLADWHPFPDTIAALRTLGEHHRLGIISNVDENLFEETRASLGIDFDWVVTAESIGHYKPDTEVFEWAITRMGVPRTSVLHCAQSRYHDIAPARELGLSTVHVVRDSGRSAGAVIEVEVEASWSVPDLRGLVTLLGHG